MGDWLTPAQAAQALGITPASVRQAIRRGGLPATERAGKWLLRRDDVARYRAQPRAKDGGAMARHDDDYRLLRECLGWSQEAARLELLLTDGAFHGRAELQAALDQVWSLLPPDEEGLAPVRAALRRLVAAYQAGPHPAMLHAAQPAESA